MSLIVKCGKLPPVVPGAAWKDVTVWYKGVYVVLKKKKKTLISSVQSSFFTQILRALLAWQLHCSRSDINVTN